MEANEEYLLIRQLRQPEWQRHVFEQVVKLYSPQLYRQIRRMVYDHDNTNDILQNTFIKAWLGLEQFRGDSRISTWLYRIAMNETLNFLQKNKEINSFDELSSSAVSHLAADEYFDGDETALQLQKAISQLPEKQRMVFNLRYFEEMRYEEMSNVLDTSVGALKASYHHAVKKICDFFKLQD